MSRAVSCGGAGGSRALNTRSADRVDPTHTHAVGNRRLIRMGKAVKLERARYRRSQTNPVQFFLQLVSSQGMERDGDGEGVDYRRREDSLADFLTRLVRVILLGPAMENSLITGQMR